MTTLTLSESVFSAKFHSFRKNSLKSFNSSSYICLTSHSLNQNQKHKHVNRTLSSAYSRHSRQYFQDSNVDEEWNGLSPQASTTNAHDVPELSLFDGERYQTTLGATYGLNSSSDVEKSHEQLTPSTAFCLQDAVTSLMSSHTLLKFPMLIGLFTLLDSHQAMAGSEFTSGLPSLPYFGDLGDISTGFASVRKTSL